MSQNEKDLPSRGFCQAAGGEGRSFWSSRLRGYSVGAGILGAKPSSRVRMFMNSSPVMVSFFWR